MCLLGFVHNWDVQASVLGHPTFNRKLLARSVILEGRGEGGRAGGMRGDGGRADVRSGRDDGEEEGGGNEGSEDTKSF